MPFLKASWVRFGGVGTLPPAGPVPIDRRGSVMRHSPSGGDDDLVAYLRDAGGVRNIVSLTGIDAIWNAVWSGAKAYEKAGAGVNTLQEGGTAYASMVDSAARLNVGVARAKALGVTFIARGRFRVDSTVTIDCDADLSGAEFISNDNNINAVVLIGTRTSGAKVGRITVSAPKVHNSAKNPQNSGGWTGASVGVEISNLSFSEVTVPLASRYTTGLLVRGIGTGCNDNTVQIDFIDNCKIGLHLKPGAAGWTNANHFGGGKIGHQGTEGTLVAGVKHVFIEDVNDTGSSGPNGNTFALNLEGDVSEFTVHSVGGVFNFFDWARWESASNARVFWDELISTRPSRDNLIFGGYNAGLATVTHGPNADRNELRSSRTNVFDGSSTNGVIRAHNGFSSGIGILRGFDATTNPWAAADDEWTFDLSAGHLRGKNKAHAEPVVKVNFLNTTGIEFGDGTNPPETNIKREGANILATDDKLHVALELEVDGALNHDGANVGFYGVAPATRPAAITQTFATADRTLGAYTADVENVAYEGALDDEAKLADLNALRVAYENLRAFTEDAVQLLNAIVDDLQANGLEQ